MIFFHQQLMRSEDDCILYCADNPKPFSNYEDHAAAIHYRVEELIEQAFQEGLDPLYLIKEYLGEFPNGSTTDEIADWLMQSGQMLQALSELNTRWQYFDPNMEPTGQLYSSNVTQEEANSTYIETNLITYLEQLENHG